MTSGGLAFSVSPPVSEKGYFMLIKATRAFTEWDGAQMVVFNAGDEGELADGYAVDRIEAGFAVEVGNDVAPASAAESKAKAPVKAETEAAAPPA